MTNEDMILKLLNHNILYQLRGNLEYIEGYVMAAKGRILHISHVTNKQKWYSLDDIENITITD